MKIKIILNVFSNDANNQIVKDLDGKSKSIQIEINDYDDFVDNMTDFVGEELEENGVYEFDEWDENSSLIHIDDDADDRTLEQITDNFNEVVMKVTNYLNKEGFTIKQ